MKRINPLLVLFLLLVLYWVVLYIIAIVIDTQHVGGEQYFLTILVKGIDLFPLIGVILFSSICLFSKEWAIRNKWLVVAILFFLFSLSIYMLFFNHSQG
ncbi:MAG: hypothetical protein RRZ66_11165 [Bacteroidales bacterium]